MQIKKLIRCSRAAAAAMLALALMTGCGSSEAAANLTTTYVEDIPADDPSYQQYLQSHGGTVSAAETTDAASDGQSQSGTTVETPTIATPDAESQDTTSEDSSADSASSASSSTDEETTDAASNAESTEAAVAASSTDASAAASSADPNVGTVTGTVSAQSNNSQIFLSTDEDELEFQFNSSTDVSECSGITAGKKLTITYSTDADGLLVATKVADAQ